MTEDLHPAVDAGFDAQALASDPAASVWVAANAGTGKTRVLVDRITRLLLARVQPARILCLTFTKAAAAEMANRLNGRLGAWAVMPEERLARELGALHGGPVPSEEIERARRLFAHVLEAPGGIAIRTIHAFCESLLGRFPLESGVAPHFSVVDERTARELRLEARDRMLVDAFDGGASDSGAALAHLAALVDEEGFARLMHELDGGRARLVRRPGGLQSLMADVRTQLGLEAEATAASVAADIAGGVDARALRRAQSALESGTGTDRERALSIGAWLADEGRRAETLACTYAPVFLRRDGAPRSDSSLMGRTARVADAEAFRILVEERARIHAGFERLKAVNVAASTRSLLGIGLALLDGYETVKRERALLDYDDLIERARRLLSSEAGVSWVHYKLDGGLDHVLVDEAQDTSPEQWNVIVGLAGDFFSGRGASEERRTVFAVGDEKQSIYGFQGARPEEFARHRAHFSERVGAVGEDWRSLSLETSFRSTPAVLAAVDRVFALSAAADGLTSTGAAIHHESSRKGQAGLVELWPTAVPEADVDHDPWDAPLDQVDLRDPPAQLANRIADRIADWLERGEVLESAGRPVRPGDIMILVRTRRRFAADMVSSLKLRGIPVAGSDRMVLTDQLAVMDLTALGRFALLPDDDLNLAVVLKGPFCGFDDADLFDLAHGRTDGLWSTLVLRRGERALFGEAAATLEPLLAQADFKPPFELYAEILGGGGGRRRLLARLGAEAEDPIEEFLSLALEFEHEHVPSLEGFLHWLDAGEIQVKRDLEHGRDEVRVMTVHGAKGLQSNIVFLPDTCSVADPRLDPKIYWSREAEGSAVLWPAGRENEEAVCRRLRQAARERIEREYRRLLYVAMTRARDRLYVAGWEGKRGRDDGCWYDLVAEALAGVARPVDLPFGETGWRLSEPQAAPPESADAPAPASRRPAPVPAWAARPPAEEAEPPRPLAPSRPADDEPPVLSPLALDDGRRYRRGRLIHRLLETLPELAPRRRRRTAEAFLARPGLGLSAAEQREIVAETVRVVEDPRFAPLFGPGSHAEVPITGVVAGTGRGHVVAGQMDRLLIGEHEVSVVDYKTNRPAPSRPEDVAPVYIGQMAAYRAVLREVFPERRIRCLLLWTVGPTLMVLDDHLLDGHAP